MNVLELLVTLVGLLISCVVKFNQSLSDSFIKFLLKSPSDTVLPLFLLLKDYR